jgi:vacuolar-type H+-ATPase subunit I/STV1
MNLSPEDIALMKQAIAEHEGGAGHPDAEQDIQQITPLIEAVQFLAAQMETMNERIEKIEKVVMEDLIGGITNLYKTNQRDSSIAGLKEKYGSLFDPHKDAIDAFYPGVDVYEHLQDLLEEMKGGEDFSEDAFDGTVRESVQELQDKIAKLTGKQDQNSGEPVAVEVEVEKTEEAPKEEEDNITKTLNRFKQMAAKAPKGGI